MFSLDSYKKLDENDIDALVETLLKLKVEKNKHENSSKTYTSERKQKEPILNFNKLKEAMELKGFRFENDFFHNTEKKANTELSRERSSYDLSKEKSKSKDQDLSI